MSYGVTTPFLFPLCRPSLKSNRFLPLSAMFPGKFALRTGKTAGPMALARWRWAVPRKNAARGFRPSLGRRPGTFTANPLRRPRCGLRAHGVLPGVLQGHGRPRSRPARRRMRRMAALLLEPAHGPGGPFGQNGAHEELQLMIEHDGQHDDPQRRMCSEQQPRRRWSGPEGPCRDRATDRSARNRRTNCTPWSGRTE